MPGSNSRWWVAEGEDDYESSSSSVTSEGVQRHLNDPLSSSSGSQSSALFQKNHFEPELSDNESFSDEEEHEPGPRVGRHANHEHDFAFEEAENGFVDESQSMLADSLASIGSGSLLFTDPSPFVTIPTNIPHDAPPAVLEESIARLATQKAGPPLVPPAARNKAKKKKHKKGRLPAKDVVGWDVVNKLLVQHAGCSPLPFHNNQVLRHPEDTRLVQNAFLTVFEIIQTKEEELDVVELDGNKSPGETLSYMRENIKLEQRIQQWITAYEEATKKHTQEVSLLKMQLQKLKADKDVCTEKVKTLETEKRSLQKKSDELVDKHELQQLQAKYNSLLKEHDALMRNKETLHRKNEAVEREQELLQQSYDEMKEKNDELQQQTLQLQGRIKQLQETQSTPRRASSSSTEALKTENSLLQTRNSLLDSQLEQLRTENEKLQKEALESNQELLRLRTQFSNSHSKLMDANSQISTLNSLSKEQEMKISELESERSNLKSKISQLQHELSRKEVLEGWEQQHSLRTQLYSQEEQLRKLSKLEQENGDLKHDVMARVPRQQLLDCQDQLAELRKKHTQLNRDFMNEHSEKLALQRDLQARERKYQEQIEELSRLQSTTREKEKADRHFEQDYYSLKQEYTALKRKASENERLLQQELSSKETVKSKLQQLKAQTQDLELQLNQTKDALQSVRADNAILERELKSRPTLEKWQHIQDTLNDFEVSIRQFSEKDRAQEGLLEEICLALDVVGVASIKPAIDQLRRRHQDVSSEYTSLKHSLALLLRDTDVPSYERSPLSSPQVASLPPDSLLSRARQLVDAGKEAMEFQGVVCDYIYQNGSDGFPSSKLSLDNVLRILRGLFEDSRKVQAAYAALQRSQSQRRLDPSELVHQLRAHLQRLFGVPHFDGLLPRLQELCTCVSQAWADIKYLNSLFGVPNNTYAFDSNRFGTYYNRRILSSS